MPTPLFTLTDSLIINQPCNYTAEWRERPSEGVERHRGREGRGRVQKLLFESIVGEREAKKKKETEGARERDGERDGFLLKGDNKEPLKEQMKMSSPPPPPPPPLLRPVEG